MGAARGPGLGAGTAQDPAWDKMCGPYKGESSIEVAAEIMQGGTGGEYSW